MLFTIMMSLISIFLFIVGLSAYAQKDYPIGARIAVGSFFLSIALALAFGARYI